MDSNFGITYVATGGSYITECTQSAKSAKKAMPQVPIAIWTDKETDVDKRYFDFVHIIPSPQCSFLDRIEPLIQTPFEKNLYVDTDTYFADSVTELEGLLDRFDMAFYHSPWRICPGKTMNLMTFPPGLSNRMQES